MNALAEAEAALREGDPKLALQKVQEHVRAKPSDAKARFFLFQLLAVLEQWERALSQLDVAATLDAGALVMAQVYREAIRCEAMRSAVFSGRKTPMVLGEPEPWLALLIESLLLSGRGAVSGAAKLREQAFDTAPAISGRLNGETFTWIADADSRLGPVLEAIVNGHYYWLPFARLSRVVLEAPTDLRDLVWMPAHLEFCNGGESVALIPTRYIAECTQQDVGLALARKTEWRELAPDCFAGIGQRVLATDHAEVALLEVREILLEPSADSGTSDKHG